MRVSSRLMSGSLSGIGRLPKTEGFCALSRIRVWRSGSFQLAGDQSDGVMVSLTPFRTPFCCDLGAHRRRSRSCSALPLLESRKTASCDSLEGIGARVSQTSAVESTNQTLPRLLGPPSSSRVVRPIVAPHEQHPNAPGLECRPFRALHYSLDLAGLPVGDGRPHRR